MNHDPLLAEIIRARLEIATELDASFELSFMERARLRLDLITIVNSLENGTLSRQDAAAALARLRAEIPTSVSA